MPIDRRSLIAVAACAPFSPALGRACGPPLLGRAIRVAGGLRALAPVTSVRWTGRATVFAGERRIEIVVRTAVRPFRSGRSESWLASEGPDKARTLILDDSGDWIVRDGGRAAMPAAMAAHERQQYAIYGLMLLAPLCEDQVDAALGPDGERGLVVRHPPAPKTQLWFDPAGRLVAADNIVSSPDGGAPIAQHFDFAGRMPGAIAWPRRIAISQDGRPYFELTLDRFVAD